VGVNVVDAVLAPVEAAVVGVDARLRVLAGRVPAPIGPVARVNSVLTGAARSSLSVVLVAFWLPAPWRPCGLLGLLGVSTRPERLSDIASSRRSSVP